MYKTVPIDFVVASDLPDVRKYRGLSDSAFDIDCPFCGGRRKLHVHRGKNVFRCNKCGESGNALTLHSLLTKETSRERALADLRKRFSGLEPDLQVAYMSPVEEEQARIADIDMRDYVNRSLLEKLTLSRRHHDDLIRRGFSEKQIKELGYKSIPSSAVKAKQIAVEVLEGGLLFQYGDYPGFYMDDDQMPMFAYRRTGGYLIPVKTLDGKISAFQIRNDPFPENTAQEYAERYHKYSWLSSGERKTGCSLTGCENIHFAGDWTHPHEAVCLTEGALKADVAAAISGNPFIGLTGVNNISQLEKNLNRLSGSGLKAVFICVDMDYRDKPTVAKALDNIRKIILRCGIKAVTVTWDPEYKGIDDYLLAWKEKTHERMHRLAC